MTNNIERLAYSPLEAAAALGISKNLVYAMLNSGQIRSIRCGESRKRLIIPASALSEFLNATQIDSQEARDVGR